MLEATSSRIQSARWLSPSRGSLWKQRAIDTLFIATSHPNGQYALLFAAPVIQCEDESSHYEPRSTKQLFVRCLEHLGPSDSPAPTDNLNIISGSRSPDVPSFR